MATKKKTADKKPEGKKKAAEKKQDPEQSGATIHGKNGESIPCARNERETE